MGFNDKCITYLLGSSFHYVGVRFLPGAFPYLFNTNASELSNTVEYLEAIHKNTSRFLIENIHPGCSINELRYIFDNYFLKILQDTNKKFDLRVNEALLIITKSPASLNIEKDISENISGSPRHLRRLFDFYIGHSIKSFIRVVRFQSCLKAQLKSNVMLTEQLYYDFGYYDQSHFIKEFKTFCGETPGKAFRKSTTPVLVQA
jgi:AraC-like DNA-binding protein